jgi:hypothetical protein
LRVVKTYILADKLCMEALSNSLVDLYRAMCVGTHLSDRELVMVARLAAPHSQLRAFVFQQLAYNIRNSGWEMYEREMPMFRKECLGNGELLEELLRMVVLTANEEEEERAKATANVSCL